MRVLRYSAVRCVAQGHKANRQDQDLNSGTDVKIHTLTTVRTALLPALFRLLWGSLDGKWVLICLLTYPGTSAHQTQARPFKPLTA